MSFEIYSHPKDTSLTEMAIKGLNDLYRATKGSKEGFFVMVELSELCGAPGVFHRRCALIFSVAAVTTDTS